MGWNDRYLSKRIKSPSALVLVQWIMMKINEKDAEFFASFRQYNKIPYKSKSTMHNLHSAYGKCSATWNIKIYGAILLSECYYILYLSKPRARVHTVHIKRKYNCWRCVRCIVYCDCIDFSLKRCFIYSYSCKNYSRFYYCLKHDCRC